MTTNHRYPAQLPPERVQAIEDSVARYRHELTQAHVAATAWQQQAEQHAADVGRLRDELDADENERARKVAALVDRIVAVEAELDAANRMLAIVRAERDRYGAGLLRAARAYEELAASTEK